MPDSVLSYTRFDLIVLFDASLMLMPWAALRERLVALDQVPVGVQVEHDPVVLVAVDHVVADHAVDAVLREDDPVLAVVVDDVALDRQVVRAGVRVDAVQDVVADLVVGDREAADVEAVEPEVQVRRSRCW